MLSISAPRVLVDGAFRPGRVDIESGRIAGVSADVRGADVTLDEGYLVPGFVDLQVNGYGGTDFVHDDVPAWQRASHGLARTGVTSFLPTFVSSPIDVLVEGLRRAGACTAAGARTGARILGVHVEGPFIAPAQRGAHRSVYLRDPTEATATALVDACPGILKLITLAPERPGAADAIRLFHAAGVIVAIGHTEADEAAVASAVEAGASMVTHLFNAMPPFHHRAGGVVAAALLDPRLAPSLVVDLHNVHASAAALAVRAAGDRLVLVTDAVAAAGMPPGRYPLGAETIHVDAGLPPRTATGTIAGSTVRMDDAIRNLVHVGSPVAEAVSAATSRPAAVLGIHDLGVIAAGAHADLVWLDEALRTRTTWVAGERVPQNPSPGASSG